MKETGDLGENHEPVLSHWQTLSHNVVLRTSCHTVQQFTKGYCYVVAKTKCLWYNCQGWTKTVEDMKHKHTITNWRVSLSKICHEWPNNAVTHECAQRSNSRMRAAHEWVTTLFGHEWHIFDNETRQLVIVFII